MRASFSAGNSWRLWSRGEERISPHHPFRLDWKERRTIFCCPFFASAMPLPLGNSSRVSTTMSSSNVIAGDTISAAEKQRQSRIDAIQRVHQSMATDAAKQITGPIVHAKSQRDIRPELFLEVQTNHAAMRQLFEAGELAPGVRPQDVTVPFELFTALQKRLVFHQGNEEEFRAKAHHAETELVKAIEEARFAKTRFEEISSANNALTHRLEHVLVLNTDVRRERDQLATELARVTADNQYVREQLHVAAKSTAQATGRAEEAVAAMQSKERNIEALCQQRATLQKTNVELQSKLAAAIKAHARSVVRRQSGDATGRVVANAVQSAAAAGVSSGAAVDANSSNSLTTASTAASFERGHFESLVADAVRRKETSAQSLLLRLEAQERQLMQADDMLATVATQIGKQQGVASGVSNSSHGGTIRDGTILAVAAAEVNLRPLVPEAAKCHPPLGSPFEQSARRFLVAAGDMDKAAELCMRLFERFEQTIRDSFSIKDFSDRWQSVCVKWRNDCRDALFRGLTGMADVFDSVSVVEKVARQKIIDDAARILEERRVRVRSIGFQSSVVVQDAAAQAAPNHSVSAPPRHVGVQCDLVAVSGLLDLVPANGSPSAKAAGGKKSRSATVDPDASTSALSLRSAGGKKNATSVDALGTSTRGAPPGPKTPRAGGGGGGSKSVAGRTPSGKGNGGATPRRLGRVSVSDMDRTTAQETDDVMEDDDELVDDNAMVDADAAAAGSEDPAGFNTSFLPDTMMAAQGRPVPPDSGGGEAPPAMVPFPPSREGGMRPADANRRAMLRSGGAQTIMTSIEMAELDQYMEMHQHRGTRRGDDPSGNGDVISVASGVGAVIEGRHVGGGEKAASVSATQTDSSTPKAAAADRRKSRGTVESSLKASSRPSLNLVPSVPPETAAPQEAIIQSPPKLVFADAFAQTDPPVTKIDAAVTCRPSSVSAGTDPKPPVDVRWADAYSETDDHNISRFLVCRTPPWVGRLLVPRHATTPVDDMALYLTLPEKFFAFHNVLMNFLNDVRKRLKITVPVADAAPFIGDGAHRCIADVHLTLMFDSEALGGLIELLHHHGKGSSGEHQAKRLLQYRARVEHLRLTLLDRTYDTAAAVSKLPISERGALQAFRAEQKRRAKLHLMAKLGVTASADEVEGLAPGGPNNTVESPQDGWDEFQAAVFGGTLITNVDAGRQSTTTPQPQAMAAQMPTALRVKSPAPPPPQAVVVSSALGTTGVMAAVSSSGPGETVMARLRGGAPEPHKDVKNRSAGLPPVSPAAAPLLTPSVPIGPPAGLTGFTLGVPPKPTGATAVVDPQPSDVASPVPPRVSPPAALFLGTAPSAGAAAASSFSPLPQAAVEATSMSPRSSVNPVLLALGGLEGGSFLSSSPRNGHGGGRALPPDLAIEPAKSAAVSANQKPVKVPRVAVAPPEIDPSRWSSLAVLKESFKAPQPRDLLRIGSNGSNKADAARVAPRGTRLPPVPSVMLPSAAVVSSAAPASLGNAAAGGLPSLQLGALPSTRRPSPPPTGTSSTNLKEGYSTSRNARARPAPPMFDASLSMTARRL